MGFFLNKRKTATPQYFWVFFKNVSVTQNYVLTIACHLWPLGHPFPPYNLFPASPHSFSRTQLSSSHTFQQNLTVWWKQHQHTENKYQTAFWASQPLSHQKTWLPNRGQPSPWLPAAHCCRPQWWSLHVNRMPPAFFLAWCLLPSSKPTMASWVFPTSDTDFLFWHVSSFLVKSLVITLAHPNYLGKISYLKIFFFFLAHLLSCFGHVRSHMLQFWGLVCGHLCWG